MNWLAKLFPPKMGHLGTKHSMTSTLEWVNRLERQGQTVTEMHEPSVRPIPQKCLPPARIYLLTGVVE
jgi:hypothetical protein